MLLPHVVLLHSLKSWLPFELGFLVIPILQIRKHIKKITLSRVAELEFKPRAWLLKLDSPGVWGQKHSRTLPWEVLIWKALSIALETVFDKCWGGPGPYFGLSLLPFLTSSVVAD